VRPGVRDIDLVDLGIGDLVDRGRDHLVRDIEDRYAVEADIERIHGDPVPVVVDSDEENWGFRWRTVAWGQTSGQFSVEQI
jgi:hypothetical protein